MWQDLAPELTFEILNHFLPQRLSTFKPQRFPWYLGQVCRSWRSTFLSPQFWNLISVEFNFPVDWSPDQRTLALVDRAAVLLRVCIDRSKNQPLFVKFITSRHLLSSPGVDCVSSWSPPCQYLEILNMLTAESARWQEAFLCLAPIDISVLQCAEKGFPRLRALRLGAIGPAGESPHDFFANAPLSRISLDTPSWWRFDWSRVKAIEIRVSKDGPLALFDVLRETRCLETLIIRYPVKNASTDLDQIPPITLPFLKILSVAATTILPLFQAPALESLWVRSRQNKIERFHQHISLFLRSSKRLQFLMLAPNNVADARVVLHCMPNIQHLCFSAQLTDVLRCLVTSFPATSHLQRLTVELPPSDMAIGEIESIIAAWLEKRTAQKGEKFQRLDLVWHKRINGLRSYSCPTSVELKHRCAELGVRLVTHVTDLSSPSESGYILEPSIVTKYSSKVGYPDGIHADFVRYDWAGGWV